MRKCLLPLIVLLFVTTAKAQYVNIPDANFRAFLQTKYPTAFNGAGQMDTTNSLIANEMNIDCSSKNISDLTGVQYFNRLRVLTCYYNQLSTLPNLPDSLQGLYCSYNQLTQLPPLPLYLLNIYCDNNQLTQLPTLPLGIWNLFCDNNQLASLPLLPPYLRQLICGNNPNLQCLPNFPNSCINLITIGTNIKCLPNATTPSQNGPIMQMIPLLPVCDASNNVNNCPLYSNHYIYIGDYGETFDTLYSKHPDCFLGWDLDTTCTFFNADTLDMPKEGYGFIQNSFLKYFKNLVYLNCSNTLVDTGTKSLPVLSNKLKYLDCSNIYDLKSISSLPPSLRYLDCSHVNTFAASVDSIAALPDSLEFLNCIANKLTKLPNLPSTLKTIYCAYNPIITLPSLPKNLKILGCDYDSNITSYPPLPDSLTVFGCSFNFGINSLPVLPNSLRELYCSNSNLTSLPLLPDSLKILSIFYPWDDTHTNNIYCLPHLPKKLSSIYFDTSKIKCLPNPVAGFSYPVCNALNNVNGCSSTGFANVVGKVFYDVNANGIKDGVEIYSNNIKIDFADISSVITNSNGYYNFATDSLATYVVTPATPIANTAFNPQFTAITFNKIDTIVTKDFAIQPTVAKDSMEVYITTNNRTRPGGWVWFQVDVKNVGTTNLTNVSSSINYNNTQVVFDTCKPFPFVNTGNSITLNLPTIPFGGHYKYYGWFKTKTTVAISDTITLNSTATNSSLFANANAKVLVTASFDPNDKQATPELSTTQVAEGKRIDYTIRFQNTGNDTAFHVVIADTLDSKLNFNSLQMIATSHNCKTTIKDNIIFFEMRDIMLPDSNVNKLGSNGFIRFTMQPKNTVVAGNNIPNKAAIYFDYNAPIITNTAMTQIKNPILPVKFMSYILRQAQDDKNRIENIWQTSNEINTSHFIIQRSEDGRVYKSVGKVAAKGFGSYSFVDPLITSNSPLTIYYRLIAVDKDGSYQFSDVKQITINDKQQTINILENPAKNELKLQVNNAALFNTKATLINSNGTVVKQFVINAATQIISLSNLANGIYYLQTEMGSKKVVIDK